MIDQEDVVELEVAVDDAGRMGGDQRVADLEQDRDDQIWQQLAFIGAGAQGLAVERDADVVADRDADRLRRARRPRAGRPAR